MSYLKLSDSIECTENYSTDHDSVPLQIVSFSNNPQGSTTCPKTAQKYYSIWVVKGTVLQNIFSLKCGHIGGIDL